MNQNAVIAGGHHVTVTKTDGSTEDVLVRLLPIRDLPRYMTIMDDEAKAVELFAGKPAGWSDSLRNDSFVAILQAGEGLNLGPLAGYAERAKARRDKLMPGLEEKLMAQLLTSQAGSQSQPAK